MKNSTKKKIFAGFIILTFAMSSLAYVSTIFTGSPEESFRPLNSFVVEGRLAQETENRYVQAGFTSLRYYYSANYNPLAGFADLLPYNTRTNTDQQQLIVQKIPANETYVSIITANAIENIDNVTQQNVMDALCRLLTVTPLECVALNVTG